MFLLQSALQKIIDTQHKVIEIQKKQKERKLFSILIVIDDFAEDIRFMKYPQILHGLYTKSRHNAISVLTSVQKYNAVAPIIRLNSSSPYVVKLRNMKEVDAFIEENSAMVDKHRLYDMYQQAVNFKPYSFFFIKLRSQDVNDMFYINFSHNEKLQQLNGKHLEELPQHPLFFVFNCSISSSNFCILPVES